MNARANTHPPGGLILKCAYLIGSLALLLICAAADAGASVDARDYPGPAWSPYLVGAAIGVLSWLTFYFSMNPSAPHHFFAHLAGFPRQSGTPRHTKSRAYFKDNPRAWLGICLCRRSHPRRRDRRADGGAFANEWLSPMWVRASATAALRAMIAFGGGMLMAFGARLAEAAHSGHGISGRFSSPGLMDLLDLFLSYAGVAVAYPSSM